MATPVEITLSGGRAARGGFYGWTLLGAFWLIMFINLGFPVYGQAVVNAAMAKTLGFDRHTLGIIFSVYIAMSGVPGPLVAISVNRLGVRRTLMIGSLFVIAGALLMASWVRESWQAVFALGIVIGAGVVTGSALASQAGVARWFVRRRALALAILYSAGAIGGSVGAWLLSRVIDFANGDWRAGWWAMAGLSVAALLIAALAVKEQPADLGQLPDGDSAPTADATTAPKPRPAFISTETWTYREAIATPAYWLIVMAFVGGSGGLSLILSQGVSYLMDLGHARGTAAQAISILSISGLIAKVFVATLGDRMDPRYLWAVFVAFFGLGLVLVVDARSYASLVGFAVCIGIGFGGGVVCLMAVLSNYFGTRAFASLSGLAVAINTGCSVVAPIVGGWLYDKGFGYGGTFYTLAIWCFAGATVLFLMRRPRKRAA
jgi:MFS family permease